MADLTLVERLGLDFSLDEIINISIFIWCIVSDIYAISHGSCTFVHNYILAFHVIVRGEMSSYDYYDELVGTSIS